MTSPHSIAKASLAQALGEAGKPRTSKRPGCLRPSCKSSWPPISSIADIRSEFEFELEHMGGDTDLPSVCP